MNGLIRELNTTDCVDNRVWDVFYYFSEVTMHLGIATFDEQNKHGMFFISCTNFRR